MSTISDLLAAFGTQLTNERDAYGIAHDLGHALPSLEDAALREVRNQLVQAEPVDPQVGAVVAALVEIVDGYRLGRRQTITLSLREGINRAVLCALERRAASTSELAEKLSRDESQISRAIARLRELDLIDPPQRDAADGRRKEHRLSLAAKQALGRLDPRARRAPVWQLSAFGSLEERTVPVDDVDVDLEVSSLNEVSSSLNGQLPSSLPANRGTQRRNGARQPDYRSLSNSGGERPGHVASPSP